MGYPTQEVADRANRTATEAGYASKAPEGMVNDVRVLLERVARNRSRLCEITYQVFGPDRSMPVPSGAEPQPPEPVSVQDFILAACQQANETDTLLQRLEKSLG